MKTKSNEIYFLIWKYVRKRKYVPLMHTLSIIYNIKDARWIQNNNLLILYVVQHNLGDAFLIIWLFRDVMCGTIHCMQGRDKPVIEGVVSHINSQVKTFLNLSQAVQMLGRQRKSNCIIKRMTTSISRKAFEKKTES